MFKILINKIKYFSQPLGIIEDLIMTKMLSQEQLTEKQNELEFTLLCIGNLTSNANYHMVRSGRDLTQKVQFDLQSKKIQLEIEIATLLEYLEG
jgi:hypothetical protein